MKIREWFKKLITPNRLEKLGKAASDLMSKEAKKMRDREMTKDQYRSGEVAIALCLTVAFVCGIFFGKGGKVITRSYVTEVNMTNCTNCVVVVATNRLDVSGSGGLSLPITGGK